MKNLPFGAAQCGVVMCFGLAGSGRAAESAPAALKCEYRANPAGIEAAQPRLFWQIQSARRGAMQTAYQILAASSEAALRANRGDLWDSGKVQSSQSTHLTYGGKALTSRQPVWWKVRVWDGAGKASGWSAAARWEMGLLSPTDWRGQWIGLPADRSSAAHNGYHSALADHADTEKWVQIDLGKTQTFDSLQLFPARPFDYEPDLPGTFYPVRFRLEVSDTPDFQNAKSVLNRIGRDIDNPGTDAPVYKFMPVSARYVRLIATRLRERKPGEFALALAQFEVKNGAENIALHAPVTALDTIEHNDWSTRNLTDGDTLSHPASVTYPPAAYLRKTFAVAGRVKSARLYASALGLYQCWINGKRVSDDIFTPGWTDYRKRIQYQTYDVTALVKSGNNALGTVLGSGWYSGRIAWTAGKNYGPAPRALAQLEIETEDGKRQIVATDNSWRAATGPILSQDLLMGEAYDARIDLGDWSAADYDAGKWAAVLTEPLTAVPLVAAQTDAVQKVIELRPKSVKEKPGAAYLFDLGQNMVGWTRLKISGPAGTQVKIRYGEMLNPDGTLYVANLRTAKATDYYTLRGDGKAETYEPRFTFHGFRYVELTGCAAKPMLDAVTGVVVSSALRQTGTFECSNPLVNKLQSNILWGQRGNYLEVPTDCPQRDERLGWMGDAQIFARTACANFDVARFLTKYTQDTADAQSAAGGYSDVTPRVGDWSDGAPAWGDAGVIVPWTVYLCYGDTRVLETHYDSMKQWIAYVDSANPDHLWKNRGNNNFGDWLNVNADLPRDVLGTAYFAHSVEIVAKTARLLGKIDDADKYDTLLAAIKTAFQAAYVAPDGTVKGDTQTAYLLALHFGLLPESQRSAAASKLVTDIVDKRQNHLSTGFVGVGYLTPTLTEIGRQDVAYRLLNNDTYPSWGYSIRHGATTIWERWDGWTEEKGFQDVAMNSFNHYSLGSVGEWLYDRVAGIDLDPQNPGYKHILLHPVPGGGLTYAKGSLDTLHGKIVSDWKIEGGSLRWSVTIPANTTATITVPTQKAAQILESGKPAANAPGLRFVRADASGVIYEAGSGSYTFTAPL